MPDKSVKAGPAWGKRLAWLVAIWAASLGALAIVAYALRLLMSWIGMTAGSS